MYKKGTGNDKQGNDAGNRTLCPYRNFSQAIIGLNAKPLGGLYGFLMFMIAKFSERFYQHMNT